MRTVDPEPWSLGVRLQEEPEGVHQSTVAAGSPADGTPMGELASLPEDVWISLAVRDKHAADISSTTELRHGDQVTGVWVIRWRRCSGLDDLSSLGSR